MVIGGEGTHEKSNTEQYDSDLSDHPHGESLGPAGWR
jgi:hypothetical protein